MSIEHKDVVPPRFIVDFKVEYTDESRAWTASQKEAINAEVLKVYGENGIDRLTTTLANSYIFLNSLLYIPSDNIEPPKTPIRMNYEILRPTSKNFLVLESIGLLGIKGLPEEIPNPEVF